MTANIYWFSDLFIDVLGALRRVRLPLAGFSHPRWHYEAYCQAKHVQQQAPCGNGDFYQALNHIALRRSTVLSEIQRMPKKKPSWLYPWVSRGLDLLLSGFGILLCALPFLAIALAIQLDSPGPVFYRQTRVGKNGLLFCIIKFRTMVVNAERNGPLWAVKNDPRLTRVGAFLRQTKLDELPQLFNILKGEMTFVGPRPERPELVYWFVRSLPAFDRRHEVLPGLTGLAQLRNGYDGQAADVYRKLRWDMKYLQRKSLRTDLWMIYRTLIFVLRGHNKK